MWEVTCLDLIKNKRFTKTFYDYIIKESFIRKCKYSKKIKVISIINCY